MKVLPPAAAPTDRRRVWGQTNAGGRRRQCAPAAPCGFVDGAKQRRPQLHRGNNRKKQSIPALVQPTQNSKEAYLERSYAEAEVREKRTGEQYNTNHIDDRKAKFLMIRDRTESFRAGMFHDLREACQITERLLRRNDFTHHPFDTFVEIIEFWKRVGLKFDEALRQQGRTMIERLGGVVQGRAGLLDEGYPASRGQRALVEFGAFTRATEKSGQN
jgi:hypothetical protein